MFLGHGAGLPAELYLLRGGSACSRREARQGAVRLKDAAGSFVYTSLFDRYLTQEDEHRGEAGEQDMIPTSRRASALCLLEV
jgi:hypothetical protein